MANVDDPDLIRERRNWARAAKAKRDRDRRGVAQFIVELDVQLLDALFLLGFDGDCDLTDKSVASSVLSIYLTDQFTSVIADFRARERLGKYPLKFQSRLRIK
jgi:hypothetical protein